MARNFTVVQFRFGVTALINLMQLFSVKGSDKPVRYLPSTKQQAKLAASWWNQPVLNEKTAI